MDLQKNRRMGIWRAWVWRGISILLLILPDVGARAQVHVTDPLLAIRARANDPLFTTYAAVKERSRLFAEKAYFMDYFTDDHPITYSSQFAGDFTVLWKVNGLFFDAVADYFRKPVVVASFSDMAVLEYEPVEKLRVQETFLVHSSGAAVIALHIENKSRRAFDLELYPILLLTGDPLYVTRNDPDANALYFDHREPLARPISALYPDRGYPEFFTNALACDRRIDSHGAYAACSFADFRVVAKKLTKEYADLPALNEKAGLRANLAALQKNIRLAPGESASVRFARGVADARRPSAEMESDIRSALSADLQQCAEADVRAFARVPRLRFSSEAERLVYLSAFNLARQCLLPPSGATKHSYYVFSRNPIWGWGHGHQVMHESLAMIPLAYMDPAAAEESQRVYIEQQSPDGLIAYRHGPFGPQTYPHEGKPTTSAPFFSWTNWEIYLAGRDTLFLREAYEAGARYVRYLERERDRDRDGMFEWGPYGIIENVRDGFNVVFQLFSKGKDEGRDISNELEALDLTAEVANEIRCLGLMAGELQDAAGEKEWNEKHARLAGLINRFMWDPVDRFYYSVDMRDHTFFFERESLKRQELIGFLPLWARVASKRQAAMLVQHLTDTASFWRPYGIPTLSAGDEYYTPFVDQCCRWNGPVWLLWDYIVTAGLRNYGYRDLADRIGQKMLLAVSTQLSRNHHFWESYSADIPVQESPPNYIWDAVIAKVLIDLRTR